MFAYALIGCLLAIAVLTGLVTWKYRSPFHPLLLPAATLAVMAGLAPLAQQAVFGLRQPEEFLIQASLLTTLYLTAWAVPLLYDGNPLLPFLRDLLRPLEVRPDRHARPVYLLYAAAMFAGFAGGFVMLMRDSPAGTGWLLDPRRSYIEGRAGVGHWYVLAQACLFLSWLVLLYFLRLRNLVLIAVGGLLYAALFLYFGSKNGVLGVIVGTGLYYNFYVRRISGAEFAVGAACLVPLVLISPLLQGSFDNLLGTLSYYDYFDNSAMYLSESERIGTRYGGAFVSSFWEYVPRGVYPHKPFIYGPLVINDYFWPGAAEVGYTPAILPWTSWHLDFGIAGVVFCGLASGFLSKAIYGYFLETRSFIAFVTYLQFAFIPILKFSPILYFAVMLAGLTISLQIFHAWLTTIARPPT